MVNFESIPLEFIKGTASQAELLRYCQNNINMHARSLAHGGVLSVIIGKKPITKNQLLHLTILKQFSCISVNGKGDYVLLFSAPIACNCAHTCTCGHG